MAVTLKSPQQIAHLREAGRLVAEAYEVVREHVVPDVTTADLDRIVEEFIRKRGAQPVYKGYRPAPVRGRRRHQPPFPATICVAINEVICHGFPSPKIRLREGDIIGIDIGLIYKGWVGDACVTYAVGAIDDRSQELLAVTVECLERGIEQARPGNHVGAIGAAIEAHAGAHGFSVVRDYVGHGVGRSLHELPNVPHVGTPGDGPLLQPGMVFTIEPMLNAGSPETVMLADGWTIQTADGRRSAQFEHMVAVTERGPQVLSLL